MKKLKKKKKKKGREKYQYFYRKTKVCVVCGKLRRRNKYKKNKSRADGLEDICKKCKNSQVYTHPSLQFLNKKEKKTSKKKLRKKLKKHYRYILRRWKKNKHDWKEKFERPFFDEKKLIVYMKPKRVQVKRKKKKKFSLEKFAKRCGISVKNLKERLKEIQKPNRIAKLMHQLLSLKLHKKKLKAELK